MEKRKPAYDLGAVKRALGSVDTLSITTTALRDAAAIGFDRWSIVETVLSIERRMFYNSMTVLGDHRLWQDVYYVPSRGLILHIKVQANAVTASTLMAFKEK